MLKFKHCFLSVGYLISNEILHICNRKQQNNKKNTRRALIKNERRETEI